MSIFDQSDSFNRHLCYSLLLIGCGVVVRFIGYETSGYFSPSFLTDLGWISVGVGGFYYFMRFTNDMLETKNEWLVVWTEPVDIGT